MSNNKSTALDYYNKGVMCYQKGDWDGAIVNWNEALRQQPDFAEALENRGAALRQKGNLALALNSFEQVLLIDPARPSAYYNRALVYADKEDFDQAIADYTQALKIDPKHPNTHCNRGILYFQKGELEKAQADLTMALQINHKDELARRFFQKLEQPLSYNECTSLATQALAEMQAGELQKAWLLFQTTYEHGGQKHGMVHVGFGAIYEKQNAFDKAFAAFDYAVTCDPSPQAYNNRGRIHLMAGQVETAIADFQEALRRQPENARAYFNLGGAYLEQNQLENALNNFKQALALGYLPAKQAITDVEKQISKTSSTQAKQTPEDAKVQQNNIILLLLAKFAYKHCGYNLHLHTTTETFFFGLRTRQKWLTQLFWDTKLEGLHTIEPNGMHSKRAGATLEFFKPTNFLIRIIAVAPNVYELELYERKTFEGVSHETYVKRKEHTWRISPDMVETTLDQLIDNGIIKKAGRSLTYP